MPEHTNMDGYGGQKQWRVIQEFLPAEYRLDDSNLPSEEWWDWRNHRIHIDRYRNPSAPFKVILFHGVGSNGRQMSIVLGHPLSLDNVETVAADMPGYGVTKVAPGTTVTYNDWVAAGNDLVNRELSRDPRPIILFGMSAGGMLAYHVAALNRKVKGVGGMTFLDQRIQQVSDETAISKTMSRVGMPLARLSYNLGLGWIKMPMKFVSKMSALVNSPTALKAFYADPTAAGNWASVAFLVSYGLYAPAMEPEDFDVCPILLTQPEKDEWTPLHLSDLTLDKISKVKVTKVILENAGHFPIEQPGLQQMHDRFLSFAQHCIAMAPSA